MNIKEVMAIFTRNQGITICYFMWKTNKCEIVVYVLIGTI